MANLARDLRWNMTDGERRLWSLLRRRQLSGFRFRRQAPIGPYVADFFCPEGRLVIELDDAPHFNDGNMARDEKRTRWLEQHGCRIVRFLNRDVFQNPVQVIDAIYALLTEHPPSGPAGHLPPQGGKK